MDYRGLTVKIGADDSQLSKVLSGLRTEARKIDDELKQVNRSLKFDSSDVEALSRKQELYTEKIKNTETQLEKMREGLRNAGSQNISTTQIERLRANIKECESNVASYKDELKKIETAQAFAKQEKQIRECNQAIALQESKIKTLDSLLEQLPHDSELFAAKQKAVNTALEQSRAKVQLLRDTYGQLTAQDLGEKEWERVQLEIKQAYAEVRQYATELSRLNVSKLNAAATSWQRVGASIRGVGSTLTGTLTPAVAIGAAAFVTAATTMDTALTGVRKTVDGTEEQYQALKDAAVEFSLTNAVPAATIMDIQALGAQLGYTIDELDMFGQVVSGLDIATNMDAETAATELAQFANITKMSHAETENYGAAIVGLGNNFATTESDISHMAMRLAAAGTQVGLTQADILGLATAMSSLGIEAEAGGSAMSTVMSKIDRAVANGGDDLEIWANIAQTSASEFAQAWQDDPVAALQSVLEGINSASASGENMNLILDNLGITELRQIDAMKRMSQNAELVGKAVAKSNEEWEKNTALTNEVENRNNSLAAKFEMVKNRLLAIADRIGAPLAEAFLEALDAAEPLFQAIENGADAFANMSTEEQQLVLCLVGLAAAAGPTLSGLGNVVTVVGKLTEKSAGLIEKLGSVESKFALLKGGAVGLAAALAGVVAIDVISQWKDYQDWCDLCTDATQSLDEAIAAIDSTDLDDLAEGFEGVSENATKSADEINGAFRDVLKDLAATGKDFKESFENIEVDSKKLDQAVATIEDLRDKENLTAAEQDRLRQAVETYNEVTGSSIGIIDEQNGVLDTSTEAILKNKDAWETLQKQQAYSNVITDLNEDLIRLGKSAEDQAKSLDEYAAKVGKTRQELVDAAKSMGGMSLYTMGFDTVGQVNDVIELAAAYEEAQIQIENTKGHLETLNTEFESNAQAAADAKNNVLSANEATNEQSEALDSLADSAEGVTDSLNEEIDIAYEYTNAQGQVIHVSKEAADAFKEMCDELSEFEAANALFAQAIDDSGYSIPEFAAALQTAGIDVGTFEERISSLADTTQNAFGRMEQQETISLDEMISNLQANQQAVADWRGNLITLYDMAGGDIRKSEFVQAMADMGPEYANQLQAIVDGGQEKFNELADAWASGANVAMSAAAESFDLGGGQILDGVNLTFSQLANSMHDMGLNISDLGTLGADQFAALAENLGISTSDMIAICDSLQIELSEPAQSAADSMKEAISSGSAAAADAMLDNISTMTRSAGELTSSLQNAINPLQESIPNPFRVGTNGAHDVMASANTILTSASALVADGVDGALDPVETTIPNKFQSAFAYANLELTSGGQTAAQAAENTTSAIQSKFTALETSIPTAGENSMSSYNGVIAAAKNPAETNSGLVANATLTPLSNLPGKTSAAGTNAGSSFVSGVSSQSDPAKTAGTTVSSGASSGLQAYNGSSYGWGLELGENFAAGIQASAPQVSYAAQAAANAAAAMLKHSVPKKGVLANGGKGEKPWGEHLAQNFAAGIKSSKSLGLVGNASNALAQTVVDYIGHTSPKKGALKGGEWVYGQHAAINFAEGLYSGRDKVKEAAASVSQAAADELSAAEVQFNKMVASYKRDVDEIKGTSTDLSVYLNEMADNASKVDLATPAYTATAAYKDMSKIVQAGYDDVQSFKQAGVDLKDSIKQNLADQESLRTEYDQKRAAAEQKHQDTLTKNKEKLDKATEEGYKKRDQLQAKFNEADADYWKAWNKLQANTDAKKTESLQNAVDNASKKWYEAKDKLDHVWDDWYELEAENNKSAEKAAKDKQDTLDKLKTEYAEDSVKLKSEAAELNKSYNDYISVEQSLTTSLDKLEASESIYHVTSDIVSSIEGSNGLTETLKKLGTKGVHYTQAFVDAMVNGGEEYIEALGDMSDMTAEEVQSFVDSFESVELAEREAALASRALYVENAKTASKAEQDREKWLTFRETVMDVKEALNGNAGLAQAFRLAGTSVEGLAADLNSLGYDMDDLVAKAQSWSESVSNGFNALSTVDKTGATDFVNTLRNNMAQTQQYTDNVQTVFGKIADMPAEATEAFRKAVLEGGFDQFAGVMADMATMSEDQIMAIVNTYNDSVQQGLQDSIAQFQALAPGEEIMIATIEGMKAKEDVLCDTAKTSTHAAADASLALKPEFYSVGQQLASGIGSGIMAQAQSIANAAASTVRQAIAAAKAEADIHSPSRKMRDEVGLMLGRGVAEGVDDSNKYVRQSMDKLINQPFVRESQTIDSRAYTTNASVNINMNGVTVRSESDIKKIAKEINRLQVQTMKGMGL